MAISMGKKPPSIKIKSWHMAIFWRFSWLISKLTGKEPILSKSSAKSAHSISRYSSKKIQKSINFQFQEIDDVIKSVSKNYIIS